MTDSDASDDSSRDRFRRDRNTNRSSRIDEKNEDIERKESGLRTGYRRPNRSLTNDQPSFKRVRRDSERNRAPIDDDVLYCTPLMPFKRFLDPLDDHITDSEALNKYQTYKEDFKKKQIEEFFEAHKDEEWLRLKYHPDFKDHTKETIQKFVDQRLDVFLDLFEKGIIQNVSVNIDNQQKLLYLLDAAVIKLDGGTEEDFKEFSIKQSSGMESQDDSHGKSLELPEESKPLDDDSDVPTPTTAEVPITGTSKEPEDVELIETTSQTSSIFFRNLPAAIKRAELEELCKSQDGFLRLAIWDPAPERKFTRYAWATYRSEVPIKKICWELNTSSLLRDKYASPRLEITASVNREMKQRIRPVPPLTRHKDVMKQDLILAARLVYFLDTKFDLWTKDSHAEPSPVPGCDDCFSANPLMRNLVELVHGFNLFDGKEEENSSFKLEYDASLAQVIDRLVLYLRIVHCFDFYSVTKYPQEDLMPYKCGVLHARGDRGITSDSGSPTTGLILTNREIHDYHSRFAQKIESIISARLTPLNEEEMKKLGKRDPEKVENEFIQANIQKRISKKKPFKVVWVCPLSDKKFREPIFVEKHILNKHFDKLEAAKKDGAEFFNNYLQDPQRPCLPEPPRHLIDRFYPLDSRRRQNIGMQPQNSYYQRNQYGNRFNQFTRSSSNGRFQGNRFGNQDYMNSSQQQAMAALATAAAALYQGGSGTGNGASGAIADKSIANMLSGAAASLGVARNPNGSNSYFNRDSSTRFTSNNDRMQRRGMVTYNDLDDPQNDIL